MLERRRAVRQKQFQHAGYVKSYRGGGSVIGVWCGWGWSAPIRRPQAMSERLLRHNLAPAKALTRNCLSSRSSSPHASWPAGKQLGGVGVSRCRLRQHARRLATGKPASQSHIRQRSSLWVYMRRCRRTHEFKGVELHNHPCRCELLGAASRSGRLAGVGSEGTRPNGSSSTLPSHTLNQPKKRARD